MPASVFCSMSPEPMIDNPLTRFLLYLCQAGDMYHFRKLNVRCRPDQAEVSKEVLKQNRPWWIRLHRLFGKPTRALRRKLLVLLKVRSGRGRVESEAFCEEAHRAELDNRDAA